MFSFNLFISSQGCGFSADCIRPRWLRSVNTILNLPGFRATKDVHVLVCGLVCMHVWNDSCITELMEDMWWGGYGRTPFTSIQSKNMEFGEILTGVHSVINSFPLSQSYSGTHTHAHTRGTDSWLHWFYNDIYCIGSGAQGRRRPAGLDSLACFWLEGLSALPRFPFLQTCTCKRVCMLIAVQGVRANKKRRARGCTCCSMGYLFCLLRPSQIHVPILKCQI